MTETDINMELVESFFFLGVLFIGVPLVMLFVHGCQYNKLEENFSKKGLLHHAKEYLIFMFIGVLIIGTINYIKSIFKRD